METRRDGPAELARIDREIIDFERELTEWDTAAPSWQPLGLYDIGEDVPVAFPNLWQSIRRRDGCDTVSLPNPACPGEIHRFGIHVASNECALVMIAACEVRPNTYAVYKPASEPLP